MVVTFATPIPAYLILYAFVRNNPGSITGAGVDRTASAALAAVLELILIFANVGTALARDADAYSPWRPSSRAGRPHQRSYVMSPGSPSQPSTDALPSSWQRLLALSGVAFAVLFLAGFLISGSDAPDYTAPDQVWRTWAGDSEMRSRIGAFLTVLASFVFLPFAAALRSRFEGVDTPIRGPVQLARVTLAGALIGVTGITMAVITIAGATAPGAQANPVVSKAIASTTVGPFLVGAMGLAASLTAAGLLILRSGVFARWIAIVALLGGAAFFITFFTLIAGPSADSIFGYGFFPGFLALTIWSIATSVASYRAVAAATTRTFVATGAPS
jgi:Domain of unknown function (DUF4386)